MLFREESCLLSHIRIHNKSVAEWEVSASLVFKAESFVRGKLLFSEINPSKAAIYITIL